MAESNVSGRAPRAPESPGPVARALAWVERAGNKLPDPAALFVLALLLVWAVSWLLAGHEFTVPAKDGPRTLAVANQLSGTSLAAFLSSMVTTFTGFAPLGVVLVALLGVGVAEHTGFINSIFQSKNEPEIGPGGKGQAAG